MPVKFETCALFHESVVAAVRKDKDLIDKIKDFEAFKSKDPMAPYGSTDKMNHPEGIFATEIPKMRHAHLAHDMSIWYTISGRDPHVIKLYGVFNHDDSGIGQPPNRKKQRSLATRMAHQAFK